MSGGMEDAAREAREVHALEAAVSRLATALHDVHDAVFGSRVGDALLADLNVRLRGTSFLLTRTMTGPRSDQELKTP